MKRFVAASAQRAEPSADLCPDDFAALRRKLCKALGTRAAIGNVIRYVRSVFKFAYESDLPDRPTRSVHRPKADQEGPAPA